MDVLCYICTNANHFSFYDSLFPTKLIFPLRKTEGELTIRISTNLWFWGNRQSPLKEVRSMKTLPKIRSVRFLYRRWRC